MRKIIGILRFWYVVFRVLFYCLEGIVMGLFGKQNYFYRKNMNPSGTNIMKHTSTTLAVEGLENLDPEKNYVFMGNHQSYTDIIVVFVALARINREAVFMSKQEIFYVPLLGRAMKSMGHIGVDRKNPKAAMKALLEAIKQAKNGEDLIIFPEGTRSSDGKLGELKQGGFSIASRGGVDIAPFIIRGTDKYMPKGEFAIYPAKVTIKFLPTITSADKKDKELVTELEQVLKDELGQ